jgi:hypothetical protein
VAGRPRSKVKSIIKMLEQADITAAQVLHASPRRDPNDKKRPAKPGAVELAWAKAVDAAYGASVALEDLAQVLASKANMEKPFSLATAGNTPDITMQRLTRLAAHAGLPSPTPAEVEGIHRSIEVAHTEAMEMAEREGEIDDEDLSGGWDDDDFDDDEEDEGGGEDEDESSLAPDHSPVEEGV